MQQLTPGWWAAPLPDGSRTRWLAMKSFSSFASSLPGQGLPWCTIIPIIPFCSLPCLPASLRLPKYAGNSSETWLYNKRLAARLIEESIDHASTVSAWGCDAGSGLSPQRLASLQIRLAPSSASDRISDSALRNGPRRVPEPESGTEEPRPIRWTSPSPHAWCSRVPAARDVAAWAWRQASISLTILPDTSVSLKSRPMCR